MIKVNIGITGGESDWLMIKGAARQLPEVKDPLEDIGVFRYQGQYYSESEKHFQVEGKNARCHCCFFGNERFIQALVVGKTDVDCARLFSTISHKLGTCKIEEI